MLTTILAFVSFAAPVQEPIDFNLGWKQGDKFAYTMGMKGTAGADMEARINLTVSKADEKGVTLDWPSAKATSGQPLAAGSLTMNRQGRITTRGTVSDASGHLLMLMLPEKPVAIGDEFKLTITLNNTKFDMTGKLVKIDTSKGRVAHFSFEGEFRTGGVGMKYKQTSVFDMSRGIFTSAERRSVTRLGSVTWFLKLVEKGSGG